LDYPTSPFFMPVQQRSAATATDGGRYAAVFGGSGNPVPPVRRGVFCAWDVARGYIGRHVGSYPRTAFRVAQMVRDEPGGRWHTPGGAP